MKYSSLCLQFWIAVGMAEMCSVVLGGSDSGSVFQPLSVQNVNTFYPTVRFVTVWLQLSPLAASHFIDRYLYWVECLMDCRTRFVAQCNTALTREEAVIDRHQFNISTIYGNKMPTRCNRGFYCISYCLLNIFRAPLCPSSGAQEYLYSGCCLWYFVLWFSSCWSGVELQ